MQFTDYLDHLELHIPSSRTTSMCSPHLDLASEQVLFEDSHKYAIYMLTLVCSLCGKATAAEFFCIRLEQVG